MFVFLFLPLSVLFVFVCFEFVCCFNDFHYIDVVQLVPLLSNTRTGADLRVIQRTSFRDVAFKEKHVKLNQKLKSVSFSEREH